MNIKHTCLISLISLLFITNNAYSATVAPPSVTVNNQQVTLSWPAISSAEYYWAELGTLVTYDLYTTSYTFNNVPFGTHSAQYIWCEIDYIGGGEDDEEEEEEEVEICDDSSNYSLKLYPPALSISSPSNGSIFVDMNINLSTSATDNGGTVEEIHYYLNNAYQGKELGASSSYNFGVLAAGTYTLKAIAYDDHNTPSVAKSVTVYSRKKPTLSISSPKSSYERNESVSLIANGNDIDGSISTIEIYKNNVKVATLSGPNHTYNFGELPPGVYELAGIATDNHGYQSIEATQVVTVSNWSPNNVIFIHTDLLGSPTVETD